MKVYVVMGNDYPDSVFASEAAAEAYIECKKQEPESRNHLSGIRIHWRSYGFEVRGG